MKFTGNCNHDGEIDRAVDAAVSQITKRTVIVLTAVGVMLAAPWILLFALR